MEEKNVQEPRKLTDFLTPEEAKLVKEYAKIVIKEFGRYIKTIAVTGSRKTKIGVKPSSDIDVIVIVDDTDVERMTREEVKARLLIRMTELGLIAEQQVFGEWKRKLHVQAYLLTEWWKAILESNPIILTMLDTGFPVIDRGFFLPLQILYKKGKLMPSKYGIDQYIKASIDFLEKTRRDIREGLVSNLFWSVTLVANSLLMELGYKPVPPKKIPDAVDELVVKKHGLLKPEHVETIRKVINVWKAIEHGERKVVSGREIDELLERTEELVKKIEKIIEELRKKKGEEFTWRVTKEEEGYKLERPGIIEEMMKEEKKEESVEEKLHDLGVR